MKYEQEDNAASDPSANYYTKAATSYRGRSPHRSLTREHLSRQTGKSKPNKAVRSSTETKANPSSSSKAAPPRLTGRTLSSLSQQRLKTVFDTASQRWVTADFRTRVGIARQLRPLIPRGSVGQFLLQSKGFDEPCATCKTRRRKSTKAAIGFVKKRYPLQEKADEFLLTEDENDDI